MYNFALTVLYILYNALISRVGLFIPVSNGTKITKNHEETRELQPKMKWHAFLWLRCVNCEAHKKSYDEQICNFK